MAVKLKLANRIRSARSLSTRDNVLRIALISFLVLVLIGVGIFAYFYHHYEKVVDKRLAAGPLFASIAQIYAAPREVRVGQKMTSTQIAEDLQRAGYNANSQLGTFQLNGDNIFIKPGSQSYHSTDGATINTTGGVVHSITAENGVALRAYELEPQLITALSEDKNRTKRRLVSYPDIPLRLVQAVTAIEDRRFFEHNGVDYYSMLGWAWHDMRGDRRWMGGGSTLTMQLARGLFLSPERHIKRKLIEILITFQLESRFTKQQIFETYANEINLGQRGTFAINGFGEAAQAYFGKDLKQLDVAECALLAGMIQSPSRLNPYRHPQRAMARRNIVLDSMVETGALTREQADRAKAEPIHLTSPDVDASEAPYFIDLVHEKLVQRLGDQDLNHTNLRIYTSLDPDLQRVAAQVVDDGMKRVNELVRKRYARHKEPTDHITYPQVALVALNPHTGQVLALVGGRNYGDSQLDHAISERPTGSTFKPFVYAAAYNTSINGMTLGDGGVFTALTKLNDDPQDFGTDGRSYTPGNFVKGEYPGMVTAADGLAHSLNIATIALAQEVGYGNVAALAHEAGLANIRATPSMAIGTYNATPLDMAGAYTIFANGGVHITPWMLASVRNPNGDIVSDFSPSAKQVLDPRVAYLTQSLMEDVVNYGTGAKIRSLGFTAPAAGKTGTEHDAWFVGYTSNLLCVIWIGNDDYTDIKIQGADAAVPLWADFMKRAIQLPQYSDMTSFTAPSGITTARIDKATNLLADPSCPDDFTAAFLDGTVPLDTCSHMGENQQNFLQKLFGGGERSGPLPSVSTTPPATAPAATPSPTQPSQGTQPPTEAPPATTDQKPKKRGFFHKLFGIGDKPKDQQEEQPPQQP